MKKVESLIFYPKFYYHESQKRKYASLSSDNDFRIRHNARPLQGNGAMQLNFRGNNRIIVNIPAFNAPNNNDEAPEQPDQGANNGNQGRTPVIQDELRLNLRNAEAEIQRLK